MNWKRSTGETSAEFEPSPPRVNLLPQAARERASRRKVRSASGAALGAVVLLTGGVYSQGLTHQHEQRAKVTTLSTEQSKLAQSLAVYSPVTNVASQTRSLTETVDAQTQKQVLHGDVLQRFIETIGDAGSIQNLSLTTGSAVSGCTSVDPFSTVELAGCLTFTVESPTGQSGAATLISRLSADAWFVDPFIPTVQAGQDGSASLAGSVGLTAEVYSAATPTPEAAAPETTTTNGDQG